MRGRCTADIVQYRQTKEPVCGYIFVIGEPRIFSCRIGIKEWRIAALFFGRTGTDGLCLRRSDKTYVRQHKKYGYMPSHYFPPRLPSIKSIIIAPAA